VTWPQPIDTTPIAQHLAPGEAVLWTGRPGRRLFDMSDWFMLPFSLLWGGFAFFWETTVILGHAPLVMVLFGLPFVAIGLYLIFGRFVQRAWANSRTWYALTDQRALIVYGSRGQQVRSVQLDRVPETTVSRYGDGSGTLVFSTTDPALSRLASASRIGPIGWSSMQAGPVSFVGIPDVAAVEALANSYAHGLR
jgi:hypothetical protein